MKDILNIFKFEFLKEIKTKAYIATTIILAAVIIGISLFMRFVITSEIRDAEESPTAIGIVSNDISEEEIGDIYSDYKIYSSEEELKSAIQEDEIEYGLVLNSIDDVKIIVDRLSPSGMGGAYVEPLKEYILDQELAKSNLSLAKIDQMYDDIEISQEIEALQETNFLAIAMSFLAIILIYILVLGSGQSVAAAITNEKVDRTMEILLSSTSASSLIHGKVLASLASSMIQLFVMIIASIVGFIINIDLMVAEAMPEVAGQVGDMSTDQAMDMVADMNMVLDPSILILSFLFFITGYFLYVYIFAALGASASKTEDLATSVMPISMITLVIYFASLMALGNPDGTLMAALSYIPFSSVFIAVIRFVLTDMTRLELFISYLILLATTLVFVKLSVKLYRMTSLNYGNTSLKSQIKALFTRA